MKKLKNFLYYNRLKIFAVIFVIVSIIVTARQCSDRKEIDLGILYAGESNSDNLPKLAQDIKSAKILTDADLDGEINVNAKSILIPSSRDYMIEQQVPEQIQVEIISGENRLYILDKETLISYAVDENFADITDIAVKSGYNAENCLSYNDGRIYAVSLEGNKLIKKMGLNGDGMYIAIRNYLEEDKNEALNINAKKALEYVIKKG